MLRALAFAAVLLASIPAWATIALVGSTQEVCCGPGNGTASGTITGTTTGDQAVIAMRWSGSATNITVTLGSETVTKIGSAVCNAGTGECRQNAYIKSIGGSGSQTLSLSGGGSGSNIGAEYREYSGGDTAAWYDSVTASSSANGAGCNVSITTNTAHDLIVMGISNDSGGGHVTADTGYSVTAESSVNFADDSEWNVDVGAAGGKTLTATNSSSGDYLCVAAAFKPTGSAPACPKNLLTMGVGC